MDKYTLQEEAYKRGLEDGKTAAFWHDCRTDPFKPESGKTYVIRRIMTADYVTGEFTPKVPEVFRVDDHYKSPLDVMYWAELPEVVKA